MLRANRDGRYWRTHQEEMDLAKLLEEVDKNLGRGGLYDETGVQCLIGREGREQVQAQCTEQSPKLQMEN